MRKMAWENEGAQCLARFIETDSQLLYKPLQYIVRLETYVHTNRLTKHTSVNCTWEDRKLARQNCTVLRTYILG